MWDLSSLTRDRTHVPCIHNHWTTREVPDGVLQDSVTSPSESGPEGGAIFSLCEQAGLGHPPTNWAPLTRGPKWVSKRNSRRLQTLRTGLTLLGKQKVGSLVPKWNLGEAKARCLSQASFLTCLPPSPTPMTHTGPLEGLWFSQSLPNPQGILPIDVCFWDQET